MTLAESLRPVIKLVLRAAYAAYCVVGVGCVGLGSYYWASIESAYVPVAGVTVLVGLLMLAVGVMALGATSQDSKRLMAVVLVLNVAIFVLALGAFITACFLAYEVDDPVEQAVKKVYSRTQTRIKTWPAVVKTLPHGGPTVCDQLRTSIDAAASDDATRHLLEPYKGSLGGGTDRGQGELAGNCSRVHALMDHDPLQGFFDECETCWTQFEAYTVSQITDQLWPATVVTASLFLFVVALVVTNIYMVSNYGDGDTDLETLSREDRQAREGLHSSAMEAAQKALRSARAQKDEAQTTVDAAKGKKERKAAAKTLDEKTARVKEAKAALEELEGLQAQADLDQLRAVQEETEGRWNPDGSMLLLCSILNGAVLLLGLLTVVAGYVANDVLTSSCEETPGLHNEACVTGAAMIIGGLGFFLFVVAGISLYALRLGGFLGRNLVRMCTLCFTILAFFLMVIGIAFAIVAGAVTSLSRMFELEFDTIRLQAEQQDCNICAEGGDSDGDGCNDERFTTSRCRGKLRRQAEDHMSTVVMLLGVVCSGFIVILYLTLQAVKIFGDGDDDDDDDENLESSLL